MCLHGLEREEEDKRKVHVSHDSSCNIIIVVVVRMLHDDNWEIDKLDTNRILLRGASTLPLADLSKSKGASQS